MNIIVTLFTVCALQLTDFMPVPPTPPPSGSEAFVALNSTSNSYGQESKECKDFAKQCNVKCKEEGHPKYDPYCEINRLAACQAYETYCQEETSPVPIDLNTILFSSFLGLFFFYLKDYEFLK